MHGRTCLNGGVGSELDYFIRRGTPKHVSFICTSKYLIIKTCPEGDQIRYPQHPKHFPVDKAGIDFPVTVLKYTNRNGESYIRDYLSWSEQLQALFCFPCRLFSTHDSFTKSLLASPRGWSANCGPKWKKLYERLPDMKVVLAIDSAIYRGVMYNEV